MPRKIKPDGPARLPAVLLAEATAQGGLNQLARRSGLPVSSVHAICNGTDSRVSTLFAVLAGLGKDLGWLARHL